MTPDELREQMRRAGLSNTVLLSREIGVDETTIGHWLSGKQEIPLLVGRYLKLRNQLFMFRARGQDDGHK
jgi:hypothetical protein